VNLLVFNRVNGVGSLFYFRHLWFLRVGVLDLILFFMGPTPLARKGLFNGYWKYMEIQWDTFHVADLKCQECDKLKMYQDSPEELRDIEPWRCVFCCMC
jgi:hypothetical protein